MTWPWFDLSSYNNYLAVIVITLQIRIWVKRQEELLNMIHSFTHENSQTTQQYTEDVSTVISFICQLSQQLISTLSNMSNILFLTQNWDFMISSSKMWHCTIFPQLNVQWTESFWGWLLQTKEGTGSCHFELCLICVFGRTKELIRKIKMLIHHYYN